MLFSSKFEFFLDNAHKFIKVPDIKTLYWSGDVDIAVHLPLDKNVDK